jgi:hypothetical protein
MPHDQDMPVTQDQGGVKWRITLDLRGAALLVRLDPVIVGGADATVAPQQGIDEGFTDKLAVAIG